MANACLTNVWLTESLPRECLPESLPGSMPGSSIPCFLCISSACLIRQVGSERVAGHKKKPDRNIVWLGSPLTGYLNVKRFGKELRQKGG